MYNKNTFSILSYTIYEVVIIFSMMSVLGYLDYNSNKGGTVCTANQQVIINYIHLNIIKIIYIHV